MRYPSRENVEMSIEKNVVNEMIFQADRKYDNPVEDIELDCVLTGPGGERVVPGFWAGKDIWKVRFSCSSEGRYSYKTVCRGKKDKGLDSQTGEFTVIPYSGINPLYKHGRLGVSKDKRHLEHSDGTPFFWLADTWWMGLCERLKWPGDFQRLAHDRIEKGFNVIQIVAGLYPDMEPFDVRGRNEAGFPWEKGYKRINPEYFNYADRRMEYLIDSGIVPCIVGCWGYHLTFAGVEKMKQHWRYFIARYGAYPVVWCLAGEYDMPYYLSKDKEKDQKSLREGWLEIGEYVKETDPWKNVLTIHPGSFTTEVPGYREMIDLDMLQTGHTDDSIGKAVTRVRQAYGAEPAMPVINGESVYEGIGGQCREQIQRLTFWACVLNGACGHTYGANGIWQVNTKEKPYGPSPHGMSWGDTPWDEAAQLPGSGQLGLAKKLLERYEWQKFQPHPEWVEAPVSEDNLARHYYPYAAGIPGKVRIIYLPFYYSKSKIKGLEKGVVYRAFLFNPTNGKEIELGEIKKTEEWNSNGLPIFQDWILVLERKNRK